MTLYPASTIYQYSNLGLSLLGEIIAKLSGMTYEQYAYDNIIRPLGLVDTRPELPESKRRGQLATGYSIESRAGTREELAFFRTRAISAAAGYSSTVRDLAKFASWQFRALEHIDDDILSGNTLREMHPENNFPKHI